MKISMYELYGKIYDEIPPQHIRVYGEDWYWNDYDGYVTKESLKTTPDAQIYLMDRYRTFMNLDQEVEIIEEEKKIPEKIDIYVEDDEKWIQGYNYSTIPLDKKPLSHEELVIIKTLNQLIDYLKSKGE